MRKTSAARRAAEMLKYRGLRGSSDAEELAAGLLRDDRERVRMERAILAWWESPDSDCYSDEAQQLERIAQRLTRRSK